MKIKEINELLNKAKASPNNKIIINDYGKLHYCRDYRNYCLEVNGKLNIVKTKKQAIDLIKIFLYIVEVIYG